jgi:hypothetical protein
MVRSALPTAVLHRALSIGFCLALVMVASSGVAACGATLPLESYREAPDVEYPTQETFEGTPKEVWKAVLEVLGTNRVPIELANEGKGSISTGWAEGTSLIWRRRRLGDRSEAGSIPLPVRYRLDLQVTETDVGVDVSVVANEETNFLILTGIDNETGLGYYRDDWRRTPTKTTREHEFLVGLRRALQGQDSRFR